MSFHRDFYSTHNITSPDLKSIFEIALILKILI